MLITGLYKITDDFVRDNTQISSIMLNPEHEVFKGHFPGNPVTPGVCMLQIIKELTEKRLDCSLFMKKTSNVKFMAVINPKETPSLTITNEFTDREEEIKIKSIIQFGETIALKVLIKFVRL